MAKQIIGGKKSLTRRLRGFEQINQNPDDWQFEWGDYSLEKPFRFTQKSSLNKQSISDGSFNQLAVKCPYGKPDDNLIGRERYKVITWNYETRSVMIQYSDDTIRIVTVPSGDKHDKWVTRFHDKYMNLPGTHFFLDDELTPTTKNEYIRLSKEDGNTCSFLPDLKEIPWQPSIHMPEFIARIRATIVSITPQRLHDITEDDAVREGVEMVLDDQQKPVYLFYLCNDLRDGTYIDKATISFFSLWVSINGPESWDKNPWVWRIKFTPNAEGAQQ